MSSKPNNTFYCSFVSIHYIICECGDTFPTEDELKLHLETDHNRLKIETYEFKCATCEKVFSSERACLSHQRIHTAPQPRVYRSPDSLGKKKSNGVKRHVCENCGKQYATNAALRYHQRVHTGERPYKCSLCPKAFTMPLFLQIHVRTHTGERPYQCPHCPKAFSNKAALLRHDRVHTGVKPYGCPTCGKTFTQSNSMKLHVNTVHLKMPAPYKSKSRKLKDAERERRRMAMQADVRIQKTAVQIENQQNLSEAIKTELVYEDDVVYAEEADAQEIYEESEIPVYAAEELFHGVKEEQEEEMIFYEEEVEYPEVMYEEVYEVTEAYNS
ncbi:zinc finger protein 501 [Pieris rapae]|uniref:zinc finger protein 501 n=1 Tax=Pieris rapae TaxID=64459 RepID=UPI000B927575|nr:zinc finger protein 501 [Pieris rapae]